MEQRTALGLPGGQSIALSPQDVVDNATIQCKLLMDIVEKTKCFQVISGKKYLQVEAWETIGAFNSVHAVTETITPITKDGNTVGYDAKVNLVNSNGIVVGSAIMPCYFTENACKGKEGDAKDKASKSAAQTFATSKAYRMNYSYVAILAGFQPLPAEEVTDDMKEPVDKSQHWCKLHDTAFFKKGKMTSYAHPIEGTEPTEWCYEPSKKKKKQAEQDAEELFPEDPPNAKAASAAVAKPIPGQTEPESVIDLDWLQESLKAIRAKKLEAWTEANLLSYIKATYKVEAGTVLEAVVKMDKGAATHFVKRVHGTLQML